MKRMGLQRAFGLQHRPRMGNCDGAQLLPTHSNPARTRHPDAARGPYRQPAGRTAATPQAAFWPGQRQTSRGWGSWLQRLRPTGQGNAPRGAQGRGTNAGRPKRRPTRKARGGPFPCVWRQGVKTARALQHRRHPARTRRTHPAHRNGPLTGRGALWYDILVFRQWK